MRESQNIPSVAESLAGLLRMKSVLCGNIFFGGLVFFGCTGAAVSAVLFPLPQSPGPIAGAFVGAFIGILPTIVLMGVTEQVFGWMYHMLTIQNKMLELAIHRDATVANYTPSPKVDQT